MDFLGTKIVRTISRIIVRCKQFKLQVTFFFRHFSTSFDRA
jgi:hypothetical protein